MSELFLPLAVGCAVALVSGLAVVLARRPVHSVVGLLVHSLAIASLFLLLAADLVAIGQVLIYSGAIVVLFLFVIALLPAGGAEGPIGSGRALSAVLAAGALLAALAAGLSASLPAATGRSVGGVEAIGRSLFGPLVVPFELTAPLLLVAIVGAVAIWRRQEQAP
ncbi:MAG TPA: NADH-quinone oxidoreductase subunit J [Chloroflexota bacterium]|nr:NADH-quinone oxidoreductase subunit J [Chloroflexota bacterium]